MTLTAEQHRQRKHRITGSRVAACLGLSPWSSPIKAWQQITGRAEWEPPNVAMQIGTELEALALETYAQRHGYDLELPGTVIGASPYDWAAGTPDALVPLERIVPEAKAVGYRQRSKWSDTDVPIDALCQTSWYMWLLDYDMADLIWVDLAYQEIREVRVMRNKDLEMVLIEAAEDFYRRYVVTDTPPPVDESSDYAEYLTAHYGQDNGRYIEATATAEQWIQWLRYWREQSDLALQGQTAAENQIKAIIGDASGIKSAMHGRITWKTDKRGIRTLRTPRWWKEKK